jgi:hypothetical protein
MRKAKVILHNEQSQARRMGYVKKMQVADLGSWVLDLGQEVEMGSILG